MKVSALGLGRYLNDKWNQLDVVIVFLSVLGIVLEELKSDLMPVNPTIMRVMRVLRIARGWNWTPKWLIAPQATTSDIFQF